MVKKYALIVLISVTTLIGCGSDSNPSTDTGINTNPSTNPEPTPVNRLVKSTTVSTLNGATDTETVDYSYDGTGRLIQKIETSVESGMQTVIDFNYEGDLLTSISDGSVSDIFTYENDRVIKAELLRSFSGIQNYSYNEDDSLGSVTATDGAFTYSSFTCNVGGTSSESNSIFNVTYNASGKLATITSSLDGYSRSFDYSASDLPVKVMTNYACLETPEVEEMEYNSSGQITKLSARDAEELDVITIQYAGIGRPQSLTLNSTELPTGETVSVSGEFKYSTGGSLSEINVRTSFGLDETTNFEYEDGSCESANSPNPADELLILAYGRMNYQVLNLGVNSCEPIFW